MNERQRSCSGPDGVLLYPWVWFCGVCGAEYDNKSLAKYCCVEGRI